MDRASNGFPGGSSAVGIDGVEGVSDGRESVNESFSDMLRNLGENLETDAHEHTPSYEPSASGNEDLQDAQPGTGQFECFDFQNLLRHSSLQRVTSLPDFPWETSAWKAIFDDSHDPLAALNPMSQLSDPPMLIPESGEAGVVEKLVAEKKKVEPFDSKLPFYATAIGHRLDCSWEDKREADLQRSLMKWTGIVSSWPGEISDLSSSIFDLQPAQICEQLGHYFSGKAPATLIKRANSMIFVMERARQLGYIFPYSEPELYSLLKTLKATEQSCSRLKGVMEALTFCRFVFGIEALQKAISSKRCYGAIAAGPVGRADQAAPLKVSDLERLHSVLESDGHIWDKLACGAFLFCVYSRARWSDFIHGEMITLDRFSDGRIAYAEMDVTIHKTMLASARRFRFLNLAAPGVGVHGGDWIEAWIQCMMTLNIDPHSADGVCMMPAPGDDGKPLKCAVETDEAGCWLRLILGEKPKRSDSARKISTHSLKSTMLSFAAKRGYSHQDRLSMGHHAHPFKIADVYARDAQARDLRLLDKLIEEIRNKVFLPDESRAGRLAPAKKQRTEDATLDEMDDWDLVEDQKSGKEKQVGLRDPKIVETVESDDESGSHITTDSSSDDSSGEEEERTLIPRKFYPPVAPAGHVFVKHVKSKMHHYLADGMQNVLVCGRTKTAVYELATELRYDSAVCHLCQAAVARS